MRSAATGATRRHGPRLTNTRAAQARGATPPQAPLAPNGRRGHANAQRRHGRHGLPTHAPPRRAAQRHLGRHLPPNGCRGHANAQRRHGRHGLSTHAPAGARRNATPGATCRRTDVGATKTYASGKRTRRTAARTFQRPQRVDRAVLNTRVYNPQSDNERATTSAHTPAHSSPQHGGTALLPWRATNLPGGIGASVAPIQHCKHAGSAGPITKEPYTSPPGVVTRQRWRIGVVLPCMTTHTSG